jgi:hypothetical protein
MLKKIGQVDKNKDVVNIVIYVLCIALFVIFGNSNSFLITTNFWTNNAFIGSSQTIFTSATRVLFTVQYRYLALFLLLVLLLKSVYKTYSQSKSSKTSKITYLENNYLLVESFSGSFMILFAALLSGIQDVVSLLLIFIGSLIGLSLIKLNEAKKKVERSHSIKNTAVLLVILSYVAILIYSLGTIVYGSVRSTGYIYLLDFIILVYLLHLIPKDTKYDLLKNMNSRNQQLTRSYIGISFQFVFIIVLIIGLHTVA